MTELEFNEESNTPEEKKPLFLASELWRFHGVCHTNLGTPAGTWGREEGGRRRKRRSEWWWEWWPLIKMDRTREMVAEVAGSNSSSP